MYGPSPVWVHVIYSQIGRYRQVDSLSEYQGCHPDDLYNSVYTNILQS